MPTGPPLEERESGESTRGIAMDEAAAGIDDDASLITQSLECPELFARLYDRYASDIHRYCARRLGVGAADDITSETFLVAFRQRSRYDINRPSARPWLYGIAAKLIARQRRAEVKALRILARTGVDPIAESWVETADSRVAAQSANKLLASALAALSAGERSVLLLVAWADLTYQEVADALNIPIGTVRSRLNRARRKMRHAINGVDPTLTTPWQEAANHG